jgi:KipI family sensor histidine kinase inhibitor
MSGAIPRVAPLGEGAITVTLGERIDPQTSARVGSLAHSIGSLALPGVREVVPGYAALTIFFHPFATNLPALERRLLELATSIPAHAGTEVGQDFSFAVRYDGPDLETVAHHAGMTPDEVVRRHSGRWYHVYLLGFVPGFAYLGELDPSLVIPRRAEPRSRVPAGSVAIGGAQTGVYPLETPGGWHLIGRTNAALFDPARSPPALLQVGDRVRFEPVAP